VKKQYLGYIRARAGFVYLVSDPVESGHARLGHIRARAGFHAIHVVIVHKTYHHECGYD